MVVENFNELSNEELQKFAQEMLAKINSSSLSGDAYFELVEAYADEMTGDLVIDAQQNDDPIYIERYGHWQADEDDDQPYGIDSIEFEDSEKADVESTFSKGPVVIDDYNVEMEIVDFEFTREIVEVDVSSTEAADDGIGSYEYWGEVGYDSRPYTEVTGSIVQECYVSALFIISPALTETLTESTDELPETVIVQKDLLDGWDTLTDLDKEELLNDYLSDEYGFLVNSYSYEETEDEVIIDNISWEIDDEDDEEDDFDPDDRRAEKPWDFGRHFDN